MKSGLLGLCIFIYIYIHIISMVTSSFKIIYIYQYQKHPWSPNSCREPPKVIHDGMMLLGLHFLGVTTPMEIDRKHEKKPNVKITISIYHHTIVVMYIRYQYLSFSNINSHSIYSIYMYLLR